jgi:hypothetical protein
VFFFLTGDVSGEVMIVVESAGASVLKPFGTDFFFVVFFVSGLASCEVMIVDESAGASVLQPAWSPQGIELFIHSQKSSKLVGLFYTCKIKAGTSLF